jgi:hypothetical protein
MRAGNEVGETCYSPFEQTKVLWLVRTYVLIDLDYVFKTVRERRERERGRG